LKKNILLITAFFILATSVYGCLNIITLSNNAKQDTSINDDIGNLVKIDVYVNDVKVETPVHINNTQPKISGPYNLSDFVLLEPVCEAMGATFEVESDFIKIFYHDETYLIKKRFYGQTEYWIIGEDVYVKFASIRYAMDGSLKQPDKNCMFLYTKDYIRLDIPATLEECYKALDEKLDKKTKDAIRKSSVEGLGEYHFGVGLWIRNTWIYPANDRIDKVFRDAGITDPDEMSYEIILGYHYYLNGVTYELGSRK